MIFLVSFLINSLFLDLVSWLNLPVKMAVINLKQKSFDFMKVWEKNHLLGKRDSVTNLYLFLAMPSDI